jgi:hypothetical protein
MATIMGIWNSNTETFHVHGTTLHETTIGVDKHGNILEGGGSFEYLRNIAKGMHTDLSLIHKTGYIDTGLGDGDTIWDEATSYPWASLATAQTIYVKSATNNENDRGLPITIQGLDSNYNWLEETVTINATNSTTAVNTTNQFLRINSAFANNSVTNSSDITLRVTDGSGTVVEIIPAGYGKSLTAVFTVPANTTAYLLQGSFTGTASISVGYYLRNFGEGFKLQHIGISDNNQYRYDFKIPLPFPEKTDMDVRAIQGSGRCSASWDMILETNTPGTNISNYVIR